MSAIGLLVRFALACLLSCPDVYGWRWGAAKGGQIFRRQIFTTRGQVGREVVLQKVPGARETEKGGGFPGHSLAPPVSRCPLCRSQSWPNPLPNSYQVAADFIRTKLEVSQDAWESVGATSLHSYLVNQLGDRSGSVLERILRNLAFSETVIQTLVGILREGSQETQEHALQCLCSLLRESDIGMHIGRLMEREISSGIIPALIPALIRILHEGNQRAQEYAFECISNDYTTILSEQTWLDSGLIPAVVRLLQEGRVSEFTQQILGCS